MALEPEPCVSAPPCWFTPLRLLGIFCLTNLFVYLDRGVISSNGVNGAQPSEANPDGSGIQGAFKLTYFQDGLIPTAFMIGLLISAPVFAEACKTCNAFRLLALGMGIWTLACLGCAAAPNYEVLILCRALVGVGEASFISLATPFIDDWAPTGQKSRWFACFYLCIPVGFALGYIVGGVVAAHASWRWTFVLEAVCMVPFVLFAATAQPLRLHGAQEDKEPGQKGAKSAIKEFWMDIKRLASLPLWLTVDAAYTCHVAVMGVFAYWGPKAGRQLFFGAWDDAAASSTDLAFGGVTVVTGVVGSLAGGWLLDRMGPTLRNASAVCAASNVVGFVFVLLAFTAARSFSAFMGLFAVAQLALFTLQSPVAALSMWCVPPGLRPLGISMMTVSLHLLGDVPSLPLVGIIQTDLSRDKSPADAAQQWRTSMSLVSLLLLASGALFMRAAYIATPEADFREPLASEGGHGSARHRHVNNLGSTCGVRQEEGGGKTDEDTPLLIGRVHVFDVTATGRPE